MKSLVVAVAVGVLVLVSSSCTMTRTAPPATPTPATPAVADGPDSAPDLGARIRPVVLDVMRNLAIPGAVVLVRDPEGQYLEAFGTREIGRNDPVQVDDHFRVGGDRITIAQLRRSANACGNPRNAFRLLAMICPDRTRQP